VAATGQGATRPGPGGAGTARAGGARQALTVAVQVVVIAAVAWFAARTLQGQWAEFRTRAVTLQPSWSGVLGSAVLVLLTYALLIESWRALVHAWGDRLGYGDAVRIWTVSNLGRYLPGKVWSIGAMGLLAQRAGVSPLAAAGSALLGTLVNLAAGFIVLFLAGPAVISTLAPRASPYAALLPVVGGVALLALPALLPVVVRVAARVTRRPYVPRRLRIATLARVAAANVASWVLYGVAFRWLAGALLPGLAGKWVEYVAVFAGSYLAGYLALVVPGGLGVRELSMTAALVRLGAASAPDAALLAVASRLWLTVLELVPGLLFVARGALRPASRSTPDVPA
jgi:hypothetical protein